MNTLAADKGVFPVDEIDTYGPSQAFPLGSTGHATSTLFNVFTYRTHRGILFSSGNDGPIWALLGFQALPTLGRQQNLLVCERA